MGDAEFDLAQSGDTVARVVRATVGDFSGVDHHRSGAALAERRMPLRLGPLPRTKSPAAGFDGTLPTHSTGAGSGVTGPQRKGTRRVAAMVPQ
jgi:hypothetical protein